MQMPRRFGASVRSILVRKDLGVICVGPDQQAAEAKVLNSITSAAAALGWTQVSYRSSGGKDFSITEYSFAGDNESKIDVGFTNRAGSDLRIVVSSTPEAKAQMTAEIWKHLSAQLDY